MTSRFERIVKIERLRDSLCNRHALSFNAVDVDIAAVGSLLRDCS